MRLQEINESKAEERIRSHPGVAYYGGKDDDHFVELKKGYEMDGQRSFGNSSAAEAVKMLKHIKKSAEEVTEAGMPASIIRSKQKYSMMTPEELYATFKEVADRSGRDIQEIARSVARTHAYKDLDIYWNRIKGFVQTNEAAPPGMEDTVLKLKKQYPGEEEKAFATAWSIYNKKNESVSEGFPYDVDHMPGATRKDLAPKGCTTCNGHGRVYKLNGKLHTSNPGPGAKRIVCPVCKGM
jgi:hypothetical protein